MCAFLPKRAKSLCLENPVDRGPWRTTVQEVAESDMTEASQHACKMLTTRGSLVALVAKDPPANAGGVRDAGWTLGQEDPLGVAWQPTRVLA